MGREFDSHRRLCKMLKRSLRVERLARREDRATIKRIVYLSVVSVILGVLFFVFGIPFLGKFADYIGSIFKGGGDTAQEVSAPLSPTLDDLPQATNSARLRISGFSSEGKRIEIYLNDEQVTTLEVSDSHFVFEDLILKDGENRISAKAVNVSGKYSGSSPTKLVVYDTKEPKLEVETPADGQSFSGNNRVKVSGATDRESQVLANGFLASVNSDGKFEVLVPVPEGDSTIEIKAVDQAGNSKTEKRKVHYSK